MKFRAPERQAVQVRLQKNDGLEGIPKKRLRLDGESEVTNDSAG
ncbi:hypothetical protein A2U01_0108832, partial [Trifolium medium]|nr:hypothetical protein [Trifolium medium]